MLGGHRVRVANTGNCIANRGESLLSASSRGFLSLLADCAPMRAAVNNNASRIFICWPWSYLHISHKHTRPTASADATWFVFQSNKERHIISAQSNPRTVYRVKCQFWSNSLRVKLLVRMPIKLISTWDFHFERNSLAYFNAIITFVCANEVQWFKRPPEIHLAWGKTFFSRCNNLKKKSLNVTNNNRVTCTWLIVFVFLVVLIYKRRPNYFYNNCNSVSIADNKRAWDFPYSCNQ